MYVKRGDCVKKKRLSAGGKLSQGKHILLSRVVVSISRGRTTDVISQPGNKRMTGQYL